MNLLHGWRHDPIIGLFAGQLIIFTGIAALFPIIPLYVREHGGGAVTVALFVAGPLIANTVVQIPAGRLTDRYGRKPFLVGARVAFAIFSFGLFFDAGPLWLLAVMRILQGACGGAYVPALRAMMADVTPPERRTRRYAQLQAVETVGLLIGPLVGGTVALWRLSGVFGFTGVMVLAGLVQLIRLPETRQLEEAHQQKRIPLTTLRRILVPSLALGAIGLCFSTYDVIWPQYLHARGYSVFIVGLSVTLFALPMMVMVRPATLVAERLHRGLVVGTGLCVAAVCAFTYPFLHGLGIILAVGFVEATAVVILEPTLYASIMDSSPAHQRGQTGGVGGFFQFGGSALGAAVLGSLYGLGERVSFWTAAGVLVAAGGMVFLLLRPASLQNNT